MKPTQKWKNIQPTKLLNSFWTKIYDLLVCCFFCQANRKKNIPAFLLDRFIPPYDSNSWNITGLIADLSPSRRFSATENTSFHPKMVV